MYSLLSSIIPILSTLLFIRDDPYLDPGSGSFLIQLIIASLLGAAFVVRASWSKIKSFFKGNSENNDDELGTFEENEE